MNIQKEFEWVLHINFPTLEKQEEIDIENTFPLDFVTRSIVALQSFWQGLTPEELKEFTFFNSNSITVKTEIIDTLVEFITWVMMNTIPEMIHLSRNYNL